ncbi:MAG: hypothetical protein ACREPZ_12570 [Rhodanobacteraceae bacterium]
MALPSQNLRERASTALKLVRETKPVLGDLGITIDERTATVIPLVLASMDAAGGIYTLLANQPEEYWVAATVMQRDQMEYVLRSAYFAKAASHKELMRFRKKGKMPNRGKRSIYMIEVAEAATQHLGWDKDKLLRMVTNHYRDLSGVVHGGREILSVYTMHDTWGDLTIEWDELIHHVDNIMVFVQLALGVAMYLSPLDAEAIDKAVRPTYKKAHSFFGDHGPIEA